MHSLFSRRNTKNLCLSALIAALYAALTLAFQPISYGAVQFRISEALTLTNRAVAEALDGLPAHKMHCSVLAEEAIKAAVKDYYDKNHIEYDPAIFRESAHEEA